MYIYRKRIYIMKRKIVKTGQNTSIISLPSEWIKKNKLEKGQFLEIEESGSVLKIYSTKKLKKGVILNLKNEGYWYIKRILKRIYAAGYDQIEINYTQVSQMEYIRKSADYLEGFEIVQSKKGSCVLKNILELKELDHEELLDNIIWLVHSQLDLFNESLSKNLKKSLREIEGINNSVIKLSHLGMRILNLKCKQDVVILKDLFLLFTSLFYLSAYLTYAAREVIDKNRKLSKEEKLLVEETKELYEDLVYAYRKGDLEGVQKFFERRNETFERDIELLRNDNPDIVHFFLDFRREMVAIGNYFLSLNFEEKLGLVEG
jgi:phosphate uptake regulator